MDLLLLDVRTAMLLAALLTAVFGISVALTWHGFPAPMGDALRRWSRGTLLMPAGWVLYALRDQIPDLVSIVAANGVLAWAYAELALAVRLFYGAPPRTRTLHALIGATVLLALVFTFVVPGYRALIAVMSAAGCVLMSLTAWPLLARPAKSRRSSRALVTAVFATGSLLFGARAGYEMFSAVGTQSIFETSLVQTVFFAFATTAPALASIGFVLMCTERFQRRLERLASLDPLTGAWNRRTLDDFGRRALAHARRAGRPASVLLIDVDRFKRINDTLGHDAGDAVLVALVERVRATLRTEDVVGRLGGEEFVVLMPDTGEHDALVVAERVRGAIPAQPVPWRRRGLTVTVSVGIATLAAEDEDWAALLRRADQAMYAAKDAGRDRVVMAVTARSDAGRASPLAVGS